MRSAPSAILRPAERTARAFKPPFFYTKTDSALQEVLAAACSLEARGQRQEAEVLSPTPLALASLNSAQSLGSMVYVKRLTKECDRRFEWRERRG
jgi:hypothetical protein